VKDAQQLRCKECERKRDYAISLGIEIHIEPVCDDCYYKEVQRRMNLTENGNKQRKTK